MTADELIDRSCHSVRRFLEGAYQNEHRRCKRELRRTRETRSEVLDRLQKCFGFWRKLGVACSEM